MELKTFISQDISGNVLPMSTCYLYVPGTLVLASGLQDSAGATLSNPWTTDARGLVQFAAPNGRYDLRVVQGGRDYRMRVQCNDVDDATAAATEEVAAIKAEIRNWYYGPLSEDPVTRPDGTDMEEGDEYHNTVDRSRRVFVQGVWTAFLGASTAALANATDPAKGAGMLGYDGGTVRDVLDNAKTLADYTALRAYTGPASIVRITGNGIAGDFPVYPTDTTSADNGVTIIIDGLGRRRRRLFTGGVSLRWAGAVGDGVADDTQAFMKAWAVAMALPNPALYIPAGTYKLATLSAGFLPVAGCVIYGDGMDCTKVKFDTPAGISLFVRNSGSPLISGVTLKDFHIEGGHGDSGNYSQISTYPILLNNVDNVSIHHVKVTKSRVMAMALRGCHGVDIHDCVVQYCARDGINTADCTYVSICDNRIEFCDDDAIACHTSAYGVADRGAVISGNTVRFAQGIKAAGGISFTITNNLIEFVMGQGISVSSSAISPGVTEGVNSGAGITITGNTIKNCIDRSIVDGLNSGAPYIRIGCLANQKGTLAAIPGENDTTTGSIIPLYEYFANRSIGDTTIPIPGSYNIIISANVLMRDIPASGLVSALGFGTFYVRSGFVDPTLTSAALRQSGVQHTGGILKNAVMSGNSIMGIGTALDIAATSKFKNSRFNGNTVFDCTIAIAISASNSLSQGLSVTDNIFDIDPLFTSSNRGSGGAFLADGDPTAILLQTGRGLFIARNTFKNCCRVMDASINSSAIAQGNYYTLQDNILECDPSSPGGFNVANKGIGNVPYAGGTFIYRIVDSDPSSLTYGDLINNCPLALAVVPSAGKFVTGHFIRKTVPIVEGSVGSKYMVIGWVRNTTGTGHVLNTDWTEMRALTGQ